jgi:hypothetical protein
MTGLLRAVACVGIATFYWSNQARADVVLPDFSAGVNVSACDCESGVSASGTSADVVWPPPNISSSVVSGEAKGTVSNQTVSLSATLSQANNDTGIGLGRAEATGSLTYYFEAIPNTRTGDSMKTLFVNVSGESSLSNVLNTASPGGSMSASASITIQSVGFNQIELQQSYSDNSGRSDFAAKLDLTVNQLYEVDVTAMAIVSQEDGTETASIDPFFQIDDPTLASEFSIVFSPGISNDAPGLSATPLPASLPLFAGGLGFVGCLVRFRKRNKVTT